MPDLVNLDRLKATLLTSGLQQQNQALFQVINQLIDALRQQSNAVSSLTGGGSGTGFSSATFLTSDDELGALPNSRREIAGAGIQFNDTPGRRIISTAIPIGLDGEDGQEGFTGPPGKDGIQGLQGPQGAAGQSNIPGIDGIDGIDGFDDISPNLWGIEAHGISPILTPPFSAGDFAGSGAMTVTVASGDVDTFTYFRFGKTVFVDIVLSGITIGGVVGNVISITIPGGMIAKTAKQVPCIIFDNSATVFEIGIARVLAASTTIDVLRVGLANYTLSTDNTFFRVAMWFKVY